MSVSDIVRPDRTAADGVHTARLDLRGTTPAYLARVRQWATAELPGLGPDHLADVLLVAVELVTNAYEHGGGPWSLRLRRTSAPCSVRVEVTDPGEDRPVLGVSRLGPGSNRGRGLLLVDRIATRWGVRAALRPGGKAVWAALPCPGDPCPA